MELIRKYTSTSNENNIVLNNIPDTYRHLILQCLLKTNVTTVSVYNNMIINGDTGANYGRQQHYAYGTGTGTSFYVNTRPTSSDSSINGIGIDPDNFSFQETVFFDYKGSTFKNILTKGGGTGVTGTQASNNSAQMFAFANIWQNTNAITSLTFTAINGGLYAAGTTFILWGLD
jgi:hypothetical protein